MPSNPTTWPDTHGRWPWAAAAAVIPASLAAWHQRRRLADGGRWVWWLAGPALLYHQTEEWVWPGGFLPWFNRAVMGGTDEFPITRRKGFGINVGLGWGLAVASALAGKRAPALTTVNLGLMAGNSAVHLGSALAQRRYNPGLVTATIIFIPFVVFGARTLAADPEVGRRAVAGGLAAGLAISATTFTVLKHRSERAGIVERIGP